MFLFQAVEDGKLGKTIIISWFLSYLRIANDVVYLVVVVHDTWRLKLRALVAEASS
jgi:hypothetical protein